MQRKARPRTITGQSEIATKGASKDDHRSKRNAMKGASKDDHWCQKRASKNAHWKKSRDDMCRNRASCSVQERSLEDFGRKMRAVPAFAKPPLSRENRCPCGAAGRAQMCGALIRGRGGSIIGRGWSRRRCERCSAGLVELWLGAVSIRRRWVGWSGDGWETRLGARGVVSGGLGATAACLRAASASRPRHRGGRHCLSPLPPPAPAGTMSTDRPAPLGVIGTKPGTGTACTVVAVTVQPRPLTPVLSSCELPAKTPHGSRNCVGSAPRRCARSLSHRPVLVPWPAHPESSRCRRFLASDSTLGGGGPRRISHATALARTVASQGGRHRGRLRTDGLRGRGREARDQRARRARIDDHHPSAPSKAPHGSRCLTGRSSSACTTAAVATTRRSWQLARCTTGLIPARGGCVKRQRSGESTGVLAVRGWVCGPGCGIARGCGPCRRAGPIRRGSLRMRWERGLSVGMRSLFRCRV